MTDTTVTAAAPADEKREGVAKHELIAAAGGEHTGMTEAVGIRYTDKKSGEVFEYLIPLPAKAVEAGLTSADFAGSAIMMLALFGGKTKATNEASRVRNGEKGDVQAQMEAIDEVFANITNGIWREKAEGGSGTRTDKALLAQVLVEALGDKAQGTVDVYQNRLETEEAYYKKVWSNDQIKSEYKRRKGNTGPALDDLT